MDVDVLKILWKRFLSVGDGVRGVWLLWLLRVHGTGQVCELFLWFKLRTRWVCMDQGYLRVSLSHLGQTNGPKFLDYEDCSISTNVCNINISSLHLMEIDEDYRIEPPNHPKI